MKTSALPLTSGPTQVRFTMGRSVSHVDIQYEDVHFSSAQWPQLKKSKSDGSVLMIELVGYRVYHHPKH